MIVLGGLQKSKVLGSFIGLWISICHAEVSFRTSESMNNLSHSEMNLQSLIASSTVKGLVSRGGSRQASQPWSTIKTC